VQRGASAFFPLAVKRNRRDASRSTEVAAGGDAEGSSSKGERGKSREGVRALTPEDRTHRVSAKKQGGIADVANFPFLS
jgi:hypothetical protein